MQNLDLVNAGSSVALLKADLLLGNIAVDVAGAITVLDAVEQVFLQITGHLLEVLPIALLAGDVELRLFAAVLITLVGQNVDDGGAGVKLDLDLLLVLAFAEEDFAGVLQPAVRFQRHVGDRVPLMLWLGLFFRFVLLVQILQGC